VVARPGAAAGQVTGHDLWRVGVLSPAEAFPALAFLRRLEELGALTLSLQPPVG
jgi:hypothetical protein